MTSAPFTALPSLRRLDFRLSFLTSEFSTACGAMSFDDFTAAAIAVPPATTRSTASVDMTFA